VFNGCSGVRVEDVAFSNSGTNLMEVVNCERDLRFMCESQHVKHGIRAATQGHCDNNRVLKRLSCCNLPRSDTSLQTREERIHRIDAILFFVIGNASFIGRCHMTSRVWHG
jgi:hypothetical protein